MGGGPGPKRTGAICRKVLTALVHPAPEFATRKAEENFEVYQANLSNS